MCIRDRPYTSDRAKQKVVDLAKQVAKYSGPIPLYVVNFTDIQLYIYEQCPHEELTIIMRRYMMKIAERIARYHDALCLLYTSCMRITCPNWMLSETVLWDISTFQVSAVNFLYIMG